jgi:ZIP family zinc transporter
MTGLSVVLAGLAGSMVAGLATGLGALVIFWRPRIGELSQALMLAAAAGVMLAATVFSLTVPALQIFEARTASPLAGVILAGAGLTIGALAIWLVHSNVPHEHFVKGPEGATGIAHLGRHWLFILAITLHNFPEGMSVGVSFGGDRIDNGIAVTIGIGLQNLPEGLAVAAALVAEGTARWRAFLIALLTGMVEPVGGLVGAAAAGFGDTLLPWAFAFAAGAMLFVISGEIIPETHAKGREHRATFALVMGFVTMMVLDVALG